SRSGGISLRAPAPARAPRTRRARRGLAIRPPAAGSRLVARRLRHRAAGLRGPVRPVREMVRISAAGNAALDRPLRSRPPVPSGGAAFVGVRRAGGGERRSRVLRGVLLPRLHDLSVWGGGGPVPGGGSRAGVLCVRAPVAAGA